ncbi:MAG: hypothetical protein AB7V32_07435, partial [Candidatus Berkiella sp.]
LLGLLVAFTFSSAAKKYDDRRQLIIQESNAVGTAYLRLSLLSQAEHHDLRQEFIKYLNLREDFYKNIRDYKLAQNLFSQSLAQQNMIWDKAVAACQHNQSTDSCKLLLPALNTMFDVSSERFYSMLLHPHFIIFTLLFGIILLSALLSGYSVSYKNTKGSFHVICYLVVIVIVTYVIIDLEYPRLGFIKITEMDSALLNTKNSIEADKE